MTKEALELSLEALEYRGVGSWRKKQPAITAIKEALAQPEQTNTRPYYTIDELNAWADEKEKQAWRNAAIRIGEELSSVGPDGYYDMDAWKWLEWAMEQEPRGKNSLAQPEHGWTPEQLAGIARLKEAQDKKLSQRTWVGLTADEMRSLLHLATYMDVTDYIHMLMMAEDKLKEKNDG